jgi:chromosome segregation and condensation protein ScpB
MKEGLNMEEVVHDHERRITILEEQYKQVGIKLNEVEKGQYRLENTVTSEFRENRGLLNRLIENQFKLDKQKMTSKEKVTLAIIALLSGGLGAGGIVSLVLAFIK